MELELRKETHSCYNALPTLSEKREQSAETIVPDYCPDIARIVEGSGCLYLRSREVVDGRVSVSGTLQVTLLYIADGNAGLKSFTYSLPIEEVLDSRVRDNCTQLRLDGMLTNLEVRAVNPRKISTRATVELLLMPYCEAQLVTCGEIAEQGEYGIETRCETREISLITALRDKDFVFSEEIALSGAKEPIAELLRTYAQPRVTDTKLVGNKIILKGIVSTELLYLTQSGTLSGLRAELPFSQIIEGIEGADENTSAEAFLRLTGAEYRVGTEDSDDARTVSVKFYLHAFIVLRQKSNVRCIADLYSTSHELSAQTQSAELCSAPELITQEQNVRETIETGVEVSSVLSADVSFGSVSMVQEDDYALLRSTATVRVLYLDEAGAPLSTERRIEVTTRVGVPYACTPVVREVSLPEISASATANGIEIRFPAAFTLECSCMTRCECLCALKAEERQESGNAPSLVLRGLHEGETLWDMAKAYRTTVSDILSANELSDEAAATVGEVLLIPRKR